MSNETGTVIVCISDPAPCFSKATYDTLVASGIIDKSHGLIKGDRKMSKMYRCNYKDVGTIEFTADHPFLYNNEKMTFEELINVNSDFTNVEVVNFDDESCQTIYNVISFPVQLDQRNMFKFDDNLFMIGGRNTSEINQEEFQAKMNILQNLAKTEEGREYVQQKYGAKFAQ